MYEREKVYLTNKIYLTQTATSNKRGHHPPKYTSAEFSLWLNKQPNFDRLIKEWLDSGMLKEKVPSVDRLNNDIGYQFDNIQLVSWRTNLNNAHDVQRKPLKQYTLEGKFVKNHISLSDAARHMNCDFKLIHLSLVNKNISAAGFLWVYNGDNQKEELKKKVKAIVTRGNNRGIGRTVLQFTREGKLIKEHRGVNAAGKTTGINPDAISASARNKRGISGGYIWIYLEDYTNDLLVEIVNKVKHTKNHGSTKRPIVELGLNGKYIRTYDSSVHAGKETGVTQAMMTKYASGKAIPHNKERIWIYSDRVNLDNIYKSMFEITGGIKKLSLEGPNNVCEFDVDGRFIRDYIGNEEAARHTGNTQSNMSAYCIGAKLPKKGNIFWLYRKDANDNTIKQVKDLLAIVNKK